MVKVKPNHTIRSPAVFRRKLLDWYGEHQRKLPWRETDDPYRIWVSEVMLQQTQISRGLEYYGRFLERFPTVERLAAADLQDVLKAWEKMGYYARARNLHRAAGMVAEAMGGEIPSEPETFRSLPGVGEYTTAAVMSIAFGQPMAVLDGNVKRVLARLCGIEAPVSESATLARLRDEAGRLLDRKQPGLFNQAMMELGALVCVPRSPRCGECPVLNHCAAYRDGRQHELPVRRPVRTVRERHIAVGVVEKNSRVLIGRRKPEGLLGGLWEFPGGGVKKDETAAAACVREIREEMNIEVEVIEELVRVRHAYTHFRIRMDVFRCRYLSGRVRRNGPVAHCWVRPGELERYPFPGANHKFLPLLLKSGKKSQMTR